MKLKARINGKDYDIVQGATFTDNFNETLDSATIVLDHVYKIDGVRQYDDVFIWNADEEFVGYGNLGDIIELDHSVEVSGKQTGSGAWSDPIILSGRNGMTIKDMGAYFELSGPICQIWAYFFYNFTNYTEDRCRYSMPRMRIVASVSSDGTVRNEDNLTIQAENGAMHGSQSSVIVLSNGTFTLRCVYSPEDGTFSVAKSQEVGGEMVFIRWMEYAGGSYETNDISKDFTISLSLEDFSNEGIESFSISVTYRGIKYVFTMKDIQEIDSSHRVVVFENPDLGELGFTFVKTEETGIPTPESAKWESEGLSNKDPLLPIDTSGIFGEVDGIDILELTGSQDGRKPKPSFYKHLLFDKFPEEQVGLETGLYKCVIDLFSETKKLEKIPLPNISVTQSLVQEKKRSCWFYMKKYVEAFSPKYKKVSNKDRHTWKYVSKYSLSESGVDQNGVIANLKDVFDNVICPEMSLTNPSLKDLLAQIMIVKDMIPIVRDDVIYALDIGNTTGKFDRTNVNFVGGTLNSDDFATDARREHSNALSQENSAHMVEYLGFRTPNSAFLTLGQLVLETRFPIYKINSIKMCYYKAATLVPVSGSSLPQKRKIILCKQDITPLIVQNTVRNALSTNWDSFRNGSSPDYHDFSDIDYSEFTQNNHDLKWAAQFKLCTIGYDIGSNKLEGWGERYQFLDFLWFKHECSYIENIVNLVENINEFGELTEYQIKDGNEGYGSVVVDKGIDKIIDLEGNSDNISNQIKSIVFEVEYDAMYNGAIMHSKENIDRDDITTVDNCNSALTVLEADGLYEREKMDRIGNKVFRMTARYDKDNGGSEPSKVQNVGTYDEDTDSIIYSREYQIYDNAILANYESTHEYVLKNYFTTVWAKYRTYSLMSYGESIRRAENVRKFLLLSKDKAYYENDGREDEFLFKDIETAKGFLSFVSPTKMDESGKTRHDERLNCGYFIFYTGEGSADNTGIYLSDINAFASGTSLCFNIATYDNVSGGNYIDSLSAPLHFVSDDVDDPLDYKATQSWWNMVGSSDDAFVENVGFFVCHLNNSNYFHDYAFPDDNAGRVGLIGERYLDLPKANGPFFANISSVIGVTRRSICKDNKEVLDVTMQFDYLAKDNGAMCFSPWICKLNDFIGHYDKFDENGAVITNVVGGNPVNLYAYDDSYTFETTIAGLNVTVFENYLGEIVLRMKESDFRSIQIGDRFMLQDIPLSFHGDWTIGGGAYQVSGVRGSGDGRGSLKLISVFRADSDSLTAFCELNGSFSLRTVRFVLFVEWDECVTAGTIQARRGRINFTKVAQATENGEVYFYLKGTLPPEATECVVNGADKNTLDSRLIAHFSSSKGGASNPIDLNSNNSIVVNGSVSSETVQTLQYRKNMFVVVSSSKVDRKLEYSQYRYDMDTNPQVNTFPNDMFVDTSVQVSETFVTFQTDSGLVGMTVNPSRYRNAQNIPFTVRSVQYYYRDNDTGLMHFVFGANLSEASAGDISYEPFNIYLSAVSKRRMDVFDENHNVVGTVKNMLEGPEEGSHEQKYDPIRGVPSNYVEAKYLESDGSQAINTLFTFDEQTSFECDFMAFDEEHSGYVFGGDDGYNGYSMECSMGQSDQTPRLRGYVTGGGDSAKTDFVAISPNVRHRLEARPLMFSVDGAAFGIMLSAPGEIAPTSGIALFAMRYSGGELGYGFKGRIYGFKTYSAGTLIHDLVPCVRLSDNKPGMYDTVGRMFYANVGLGEFRFKI